MRLPALPGRRFWRVAFNVAKTVMTVAVAAVVWMYHQSLWDTLRTHPYFAATDVIVRGVGTSISEVDVRSWIGIDSRTSLWELNPVQVRERLEAHPLIARATVRREFPNRVYIHVRERRPAAIAVMDRYYYVDRDGQVISVLGPAQSLDYPLLTGLEVDTSPGYRTWVFRRALRLVRLCDRISCLGGVSEINVDRGRGLVLYPMYRRTAVLLGWGSWREKLARVEHVLRMQPDPAGELIVVDARHRNQVVIQRHTAPAHEPPPGERRGVHI